MIDTRGRRGGSRIIGGRLMCGTVAPWNQDRSLSFELKRTMKKKQKRKKSAYTRKKIIDEFTDLPISRQQKWQLRRAKEGRCVICGEPKATAWHCLKHAIANREWARKYSGSVRRNKTLTYKLASKARKKKK
jgi:hypothetical protein